MQNYELAATQSVQSLKEKHMREINEMIEQVYSGMHPIKYTLSKELMNLRAQERLMFQVKQLERAEEYRRQGDEREAQERHKIEVDTVHNKIDKEE